MSATATRRSTQTGGRSATTRHIPPKLALAVGMPTTPAPEKWRWSALTKIARMESGHTPSRRHPEYWDGTVPWIGIKDAKINHGRRIEDTQQKTNDLGLANSSARLLPKNTVCLSRTASVGYVLVMARPMATSQDFVNWVCSDKLDPDFLKYLLIAEGDEIVRFASGAVHQTIYFPEVKAFHICHPEISEQQRIVGVLDEAFDGISTAKANADKNYQNARDIFESQLNDIFTQQGDGWVEKNLCEVCEIASSLVDPRDQEFANLTHVGAGNIASKTGALAHLKTAREEGLISGKFYFDESMVLYSKIRPYLMKVARPDFEGLCSADMYPLTPVSNQLTRDYLYYLLLSARFTEYAIRGSARAGMPKVNRKHLFKYRTWFPPVNIQTVLSARLDDLHANVQSLEAIYRRKIVALDDLTKTLLHRAFSGLL